MSFCHFGVSPLFSLGIENLKCQDLKYKILNNSLIQIKKKETIYKMEKYDFNHDGKVDCEDATTLEKIRQAELNDLRDKTQSRMAWVALFSIIVITILLFMPFIPDSRISALSNVMDLFYIAQASVIGFYMGAKAYMTGKRQTNYEN